MRLAKLIFMTLLMLPAAICFGQSSAIDEVSPERDPVEAVHIFPNPAIEYVSVKMADIPVSKIRVAVHNILGNKMEIETELVAEFELRIRVKDLPSGYYLLAVKDEDTQYRGTFKFLKR